MISILLIIESHRSMPIFMPPINFSLTRRTFYLKSLPKRKQEKQFSRFFSPVSADADRLGSRSRLPFDPCRRSAAFVQLSITSRFDRVTSIWNRANPQLRDLAVYEAGKPIEETARELGLDPSEIIKLASNENALGPSPKAVTAMRAAIESAQLYPEGSSVHLREAIAERLGLSRENIILGNGSNEVIEFVAHAFLNRGDEVITSEYAFIAYKLIAQLFDARTIETPTTNFQPELDEMLRKITPKTKIIFIANPNNPTGSLIGQKKIDNFLARVPDEVITVWDEAYFEFLDDPPDTLRYVRNGRNVVILRTFSKIHGLASLRLGYGIARPELTEVLQKTRQPFNVNGIAQSGALAAL